MIHVQSLAAVRPERPTLLTIGSFDGVHLGHQALIRELVAAARARGRRAAVLTFFPHPSVVLRGRQPAFYIHRPDEKTALLAELDVDLTITHPFDMHVSRITATDFVRNLRSSLDMRELWAGADFALGHGREGTVEWLSAHGPEFGYVVHVVDPVTVDGEVISSSRVRHALRAGNVEEAARCLGRPLRVPGVVVAGDGRGRSLGFPTANLAIWAERAYPAPGVYACWATVGERTFPAVTNTGVRPALDGATDSPTIRAHLLDFEREIPGQRVVLDFVARLRAEVEFTDVERLAAQIRADIERAREALSERVSVT